MNIPNYIKTIAKKLNENNFEIYIVGGCVRDLLMGKIPVDWDLTTNAKPKEILKIFKHAKYENVLARFCLKKKMGRKQKRFTRLPLIVPSKVIMTAGILMKWFLKIIWKKI